MRIFDTFANRFTSLSSIMDKITKKQVIYFGESHGKQQIIKLQNEVLQSLITDGYKVNLYLEHFAFNQQKYIDDYMALNLDIYELYQEYQKSMEGHNILKYQELLETARYNNVNVQAGFIPREIAKVLMKQGENEAIDIAQELKYLPEDDQYSKFLELKSSEDHYAFFTYLITQSEKPDDKFREMFKAQLIKDNAMAYKVRKDLDQCKSDKERFLVICGSGHCEYGFGVPERVDFKNSCLISVRNKQDYDGTDEYDESTSDEMFEFIKNRAPADYIFFYENDIKQEVQETYDQVADKVENKGVTQQDKIQSMLQTGYTTEEINIIRQHNNYYQGVGCPQKLANIKSQEIVIDLGCGFGLDSQIAAHKVGINGKVYSIDISQGEIQKAKQLAQNFCNIQFQVCDIDQFECQQQADVIISNGAFCLLPDKVKSFQKVYNLLKIGGRFSIACSVLKQNLDSNVQWPLCMNQFYPLDQIESTLKQIGFTNINIDMSDSLMISNDKQENQSQKQENEDQNQEKLENENQDQDQEKQKNEDQDQEKQEDQENEDQDQEKQKKQENEDQQKQENEVQKEDSQQEQIKVYHNNDERFKHLQNFNMNDLCARVVIYGEKH